MCALGKNENDIKGGKKGAYHSERQLMNTKKKKKTSFK